MVKECAVCCDEVKTLLHCTCGTEACEGCFMECMLRAEEGTFACPSKCQKRYSASDIRALTKSRTFLAKYRRAAADNEVKRQRALLPFTDTKCRSEGRRLGKPIRCAKEGCRGFVRYSDPVCHICHTELCVKCHETKIKGHTCREDAVETVKYLKENTKPCPSCGTPSERVSGCAQVFCMNTECLTVWSWDTGKAVPKGTIIHARDYVTYRQRTNSKRVSHAGEGGSIRETKAMTREDPIAQYRCDDPLVLMKRFKSMFVDVEYEYCCDVYREIFEQVDKSAPGCKEEGMRRARVNYLNSRIDDTTFDKTVRSLYTREQKVAAIHEVITCMQQSLQDITRHVAVTRNLLEFSESLAELLRVTMAGLEEVEKIYNGKLEFIKNMRELAEKYNSSKTEFIHDEGVVLGNVHPGDPTQPLPLYSSTMFGGDLKGLLEERRKMGPHIVLHVMDSTKDIQLCRDVQKEVGMDEIWCIILKSEILKTRFISWGLRVSSVRGEDMGKLAWNLNVPWLLDSGEAIPAIEPIVESKPYLCRGILKYRTLYVQHSPHKNVPQDVRNVIAKKYGDASVFLADRRSFRTAENADIRTRWIVTDAMPRSGCSFSRYSKTNDEYFYRCTGSGMYRVAFRKTSVVGWIRAGDTLFRVPYIETMVHTS